ncbi:unnamed protein product, partial [Symbiodinium microadriaticum]
VQMKPEAASGNYELALLVSTSDRSFSVPLKRNPALGTMLRPVIWIRGRNKSVTIGEVSANGFEQVSSRLMQLRQAMTLLQPGDSSSSELLTSPWLVVRAWARQESAKVTAKSLADTDEDTSDQETAIKEVLQSHLTHMVRSCSSPGLFVAGGSEAGMILRRETSLGGEIPLDMKFSVQGEPADPVKQAATSQDTGAGDEQTTKENNSSESSSESEDEGNL